MDCFNQILGGSGLRELFAQGFNVGFDGFFVGGIAERPKPFEEKGSAQDSSPTLHEQF